MDHILAALQDAAALEADLRGAENFLRQQEVDLAGVSQQAAASLRLAEDRYEAGLESLVLGFANTVVYAEHCREARSRREEESMLKHLCHSSSTICTDIAFVVASRNQCRHARHIHNRICEPEYLVTVLESQRRSLESESQLLTIRRSILDTRIDLHLALGGGFDTDQTLFRDFLSTSDEVSEETLRRYGLRFEDVANAATRSSLDMPG